MAEYGTTPMLLEAGTRVDGPTTEILLGVQHAVWVTLINAKIDPVLADQLTGQTMVRVHGHLNAGEYIVRDLADED